MQLIHTYRVNNSAYTIDGDDVAIRMLSKVNIFVGSNNSGKSRLLRCLFAMKDDQFLSTDLNLDSINHMIQTLKLEVMTPLNTPQSQLTDANGIKETMSKLQTIDWLTKGSPVLIPLSEALDLLIRTVASDTVKVATRSMMTGSGSQHLWERVRGGYKSLAEENSKLFQTLTSNFSAKDSVDFGKVYIPTLRGLRRVSLEDNEHTDLYAERTANDYFDGNADGIFTGLNLYNQITDLLLGDMEDRKIVTNFQTFLSQSFFDGAEVVLIPKRKHDVLNVRIGNEEKPIFNLGDGIQSLIVLTFPMFLHENQRTLFFIEEPEQYLHPGLQRKFFQSLFQFANHQFFMTTHSNHLLDLTLDFSQVSVYKFLKNPRDAGEPTFSVENVSNEDTSILTLLGVQNSSVMLSNCTIWVEGITDRLYLRRYLDIYQKSINSNEPKFKEDVHYSFVEYGGSNVTHWSFLDGDEVESSAPGINVDRVCSRLFLIADSDGGTKASRLDRLQEQLGERFCQLPCREIENLLSVSTLKSTIADYEKLAVEQLSFRQHELAWNDYQNEPLGKFIESQLENKQRLGRYSDDSGTVSRKTDFCRRALNYINTPEDMSESALLICKNLYEFIQSCNPGV